MCSIPSARTFAYLTPTEDVVEGLQDRDREVDLSVRINAYPQPDPVEWWKDGQKIEIGDRHYELR